jgi:dienelactone hydrolase
MRRLASLLILLALAAEAAAQASPSPAPVAIPWRPGNAQVFQAGSPEEGGRRAEQGALPATIMRPDGRGPFPFVVLLHGCGGLDAEAMWTKWVRPWANLLNAHGVGVAIVDSFGPRGVENVCRSNVAAWAVRRADDAYSVRAWLAQQSYVDASRIAVMGMSNGGRTVLAVLRTDRRHAEPFRAGVALYPGCQSDVAARFYAPLLVLIGRADAVTPASACEELAAGQPAEPEMRLIVYPHGPHAFDMELPERRHLGMRLGHDGEAAADARNQVIAFLRASGVVDR